MKRYSDSLILVVLCFGLFFFSFKVQSQTSSTKQDSSLDLYLLIGQSNMAGRGPLDTTISSSDPRILMLDSNNQWVPAIDPLHFDKPMAGVGPGLNFAKAMLEKYPDQRIGLIPCAWGGSPIRVWAPGTKYLDHFPYDEAIFRAKTATKTGVLKGILWHQGESDNDPEKAASYFENLKTLITNLRRDLNAPNLPFIAGEIGYFNREDHINSVLKQLPDSLPFTAVVSAEGLTDKGDRLHFDTPSAHKLGLRYAKAIQQLRSAITSDF
ncbi:sialate O-acetylesterase [Echinicola soli]|uniref:Sialate O-acetylesterase n=1 Tax=Echinicola soli TaxID=2591634 RepID=A0A514CGK4_9BACT|nr:sialate O-acetylesterase [Echinicola soli]QDH78955.1 sialate O-acetylesterase [Echinicola soli]